jgi:hypothetical protein
VRHAGTGRRHACHCIPYGSTSAATSSPYENATANHYAPTLEATTIRVQDTPWWPDRGKDRQGGRLLCGVAHHTSPCIWIVRHACNSPSPWPIKGRWTPPPQGTRDNTRYDTTHAHSPILPQHLNSFRSLHQGLGGHASSPVLLVAAPLQAPRCWAI